MVAGGELVAFVGACDLDEADRFYGGVLGLRLIESSEFARAYDANGTQLRVTRVAAVAAAGYTVLGWSVRDLAAAMLELSRAGVSFLRYEGLAQDHNGVWSAPGGSRIAWFADPDGNVLSLQEGPFPSPASASAGGSGASR